MLQFISAISCLAYAYLKVPYFQLTREELKPHGKIIARSFKLGVPIALQSSMIAVSCMALQGVVNGFGETVMAAYTASMRIEQLVQQPFISLNAAVSAFTGQNIGAGKQERAVSGMKSALKIGSVFAIVMFVVFTLFGRNIVGFFVSGRRTIAIGAAALIMTGCCYIPLGAIHIVRGFLNGTGDTGFALVNGLTEVICRIGFSLILTRIAFIGWRGIWITTSITWVATAAVCIIRYKRGSWRLKMLNC